MSTTSKKLSNVFSAYQSESPVVTEMRRLYHNARTPINGVSPKSFLITSTNRGEGKSTIAANLAVTIGQFPKKKVLLIDADLRRPRVHDLFGIECEPGLRECLESAIDPMEVVKETELPNLQAITAGAPSGSPGKLFESETLSEMMKKVSFYYDVVLIDSAPVLAVSDTLFLVSEIDRVLLVILAGVTPREVVTRACNILEDSNATVGGVILNNATSVLPYYYDYKYYGSAYKK
jgi:capsular exopolysaccharide synthesis family protein